MEHLMVLILCILILCLDRSAPERWERSYRKREAKYRR